MMKRIVLSAARTAARAFPARALFLAVTVLFMAKLSGAQVSAPRVAPSAADVEGVRRAVLDYVDGFYEGDTTKLIRSLRPDLSKYGFWKKQGASTYSGERMTYREAIDYAANFRKLKRTTPPNAPREIELLDVRDQIASARLRAWWGTDYLLLGKYDGRWMILQVLWQGP